MQRTWIRTTRNRTCNGCYSQRNDLHSCQGPYGLPKLRGPPTCLNASERRIAPLIPSPSNWSLKFVFLTTLAVHLTNKWGSTSNVCLSREKLSTRLDLLLFSGTLTSQWRDTRVYYAEEMSFFNYCSCVVCAGAVLESGDSPLWMSQFLASEFEKNERLKHPSLTPFCSLSP